MFLHAPWNFEFFYDRLQTGLRDDIGTFKSFRISGVSLEFEGLIHSKMEQIAT